MNAFILALRIILGLDQPFTTDDTWDCYQDSQGQHVCEREVSPCHYEHSQDECTIRVIWTKTVITEVE